MGTHGTPARTFIARAGEAGAPGFEFPPEHGGLDVVDFRHNMVIAEVVASSGRAGDTFTMQNDIIVPYLLHLTTEPRTSTGTAL